MTLSKKRGISKNLFESHNPNTSSEVFSYYMSFNAFGRHVWMDN